MAATDADKLRMLLSVSRLIAGRLELRALIQEAIHGNDDAYLEARDQILVGAQKQLDEMAAAT